MENQIFPPRPAEAAEHDVRVMFVSQALFQHYRSTQLIDRGVKAAGAQWWNRADGRDPMPIRWASFPFKPSGHVPGALDAWYDFYVIPVFAPEFMEVMTEGKEAARWVMELIAWGIQEAKKDGVKHLIIGLGAATKLATGHGAKILAEMHIPPWVNINHGNSGTVAMVLEEIIKAGIEPGDRVAVIGAYGPMGEAIAEAMIALKPSSLLLIGRSGAAKAPLIERVATRLRSLIPPGQATVVEVGQDKEHDCLRHRPQVVVLATTAMSLYPHEVPPGTLVIDPCTPAACEDHPEWHDNRIVLAAGCAQVPAKYLPNNFGYIGSDLGAGGPLVMYGCSAEMLPRAATPADWRHVAESKIPLSEVEWNTRQFRRFGIGAQPHLMFGKLVPGKYVHDFVRAGRQR